MITPNGRFLGRKPDSEDKRDHRFSEHHPQALAAVIPPSVDLRDRLPECYDQGNLGSCGANAGAALMAFLFPGFVASRLQIYRDVRVLEGDPNEDSGVETRDVLKVLATIGAIPEAEWPYDIAKFAEAPPAAVEAEAAKHKLDHYSRLETGQDYLACLASRFPFELGFQVPALLDSDEVARTGIMPMPNPSDKILDDGHDTLAVGYTLKLKETPEFKTSGVDPVRVTDVAILIRNSWSPKWGLRGHFWMPLAYADAALTGNDAWTGRLAA